MAARTMAAKAILLSLEDVDGSWISGVAVGGEGGVQVGNSVAVGPRVKMGAGADVPVGGMGV